MSHASSTFLRHLAQTSPEPMLFEVADAEGVYVYNTEGKKFIDFISGIAVSNVGHGHPEVTAAIVRQAQAHLHTMVYGEHVQSTQVKYAEFLAQQLGEHLDVVYFVNSGSEAVEGALKVAKKFTGRTGIVACTNSYHGSTHGALSVTGADWLKEGYGPFLPHVQFITFNEISALEHITETTACFIVEPVQGEAGVRLPSPNYLEAVRKRCDDMGTLLIFDEIQSGFGRTGSPFAHQHYGVKPDILLLGKALGGGMPLGAFISRREVMGVLSHDPVLGHITTFGGHPVCCAAGLAAATVIHREGLPEAALQKEQWVRESFAHPRIKEIRGRGLMLAAEFDGSQVEFMEVVRRCWSNGLLIDWFLHCGTAFRLAPPLVISEAEIREAGEIFRTAMG